MTGWKAGLFPQASLWAKGGHFSTIPQFSDLRNMEPNPCSLLSEGSTRPCTVFFVGFLGAPDDAHCMWHPRPMAAPPLLYPWLYNLGCWISSPEPHSYSRWIIELTLRRNGSQDVLTNSERHTFQWACSKATDHCPQLWDLIGAST